MMWKAMLFMENCACVYQPPLEQPVFDSRTEPFFFYQLITSSASTRVFKISDSENRVRALAYIESCRVCKTNAGPQTRHAVVEREICRLMRRHAYARLFVVLMADESQHAECQVGRRRPCQKGDDPAGHDNLRVVARIQQQLSDVGSATRVKLPECRASSDRPDGCATGGPCCRGRQLLRRPDAVFADLDA